MTDGGTSAAAPTPDKLIVVAKGGGYLAAGDIFNYAARLVAALVLAKALGADDYGIYTLSVNVAFLAVGLGNLGIDTAMERFIAILQRRNDEPGVQGTVQLGIALTTIAALIVSTAVFFGAERIALDVFDNSRLAPMFRISAFIVPFLMFTTLLTAIVRGFKRMDYSAIADDFVQPLVRVFLIGVFAVVGLSATVALVIFGVSYVAAAIVLVRLLHRLAPLNRPVRAARHDVREIMKFSFPFWFAGMLSQVRKNVQPVLLGVYSTSANVGIISLANSANLLGRVAIMSIRQSLRPILAETLDEGDTTQTKHLYQATTRWTLTANLPVFLVMVLYPDAILSLFGKSFEAGADALRILAWAELANAATGTAGTLIDMSGLNLVKMVNKTVQVTITLALNVVLIARWGLIGAAVAALVSMAIIQVVRVVEVRIFLGHHPYNIRILKPVLAGLVALGAGAGMGALLATSGGLIPLLIDIVVVGVVYVATLLALGLPDEDRIVAQTAGRQLRLRIRRLRNGR